MVIAPANLCDEDLSLALAHRVVRSDWKEPVAARSHSVDEGAVGVVWLQHGKRRVGRHGQRLEGLHPREVSRALIMEHS